MAIKTRYRVLNNSGTYDVVHMETSASQVITDDSRQFITKQEKEEIARSKSYMHNQTASSSSWQINHSLGRFPSVTLMDSSGAMIMGDIIYINANSIRVDFNIAITGKAYLN